MKQHNIRFILMAAGFVLLLLYVNMLPTFGKLVAERNSVIRETHHALVVACGHEIEELPYARNMFVERDLRVLVALQSKLHPTFQMTLVAPILQRVASKEYLLAKISVKAFCKGGFASQSLAEYRANHVISYAYMLSEETVYIIFRVDPYANLLEVYYG